MEDRQISLVSVGMEYTGLTKKAFDENRDAYDRTVVYIRLQHFMKYCKLSKICAATKKGTKMTFVPLSSLEDYSMELKNIIEEGKRLEMPITDEIEELYMKCRKELEQKNVDTDDSMPCVNKGCPYHEPDHDCEAAEGCAGYEGPTDI